MTARKKETEKKEKKCGDGTGCLKGYEQMKNDMGGYAPDTLKAIKKLNPGFLDTLQDMDRVVTTDGAIDKKNKRLMALACVCVRMCVDCVYPQARVAKQYGATKEEIIEAVQVAVLVGGVPCWSCAKEGIAQLFAEWDKKD
ncbi:MAG: carboxymuconolactone decarboxylase family protein [Candidatus Methanomethylophilus sp.]|nr:carboxymuconolactone decarboxylase family protein [Methanomethylophilus sp.]MDD4669243.1 carboxymuconolactone decarboxylase family protein [Methanomethylophilus sp.]